MHRFPWRHGPRCPYNVHWASAELFDFIVIHEFLQVNCNLEIIVIGDRHRIEMESILRFKVPIEANDTIFQPVNRFTFLIDSSPELAQQLLAILMGCHLLAIRQESIRHQMLVLHHLVIKSQTFLPMCQILEKHFLPGLLILPSFLYACPVYPHNVGASWQSAVQSP